MSHTLVNITTPIRLRFAVVSGTWESIEWDDEECAWEFTPGPMDTKVELDPWELRKEFLGLRHDDRDRLRDFLRRTGAFCWLNEYRGLTEAELWEFQAAIRQELLKPTISNEETKNATAFRDVIHNRIQVYVMNVYIGLEAGVPVGAANTLNTFDAILSTVLIDRLRKLRFKLCARPDCAIIYGLTSRHKRKFCSYNCAHLMTVRRSRKAKKKKKESDKNRKQTLLRSPPLRPRPRNTRMVAHEKDREKTSKS